MANLIKIDRNGSKHYEGYVPCPRCEGKGIYYIGVCNGQLVPSWVDEGVCFKCNGSGKIYGKWIERTPEYQAKLDARREAKHQKYLEEHAEEIAAREKEIQDRIEAERKAQEEEEARAEAKRKAESERKAKSQYVGNVGDKIEMEMTFNFTASFEIDGFYGYGKSIMHIHNFSDSEGNTFIWKTEKGLEKQVDSLGYDWISPEVGTKMVIKGTIKEHNEYKEEKQTILTRCKVKY